MNLCMSGRKLAMAYFRSTKLPFGTVAAMAANLRTKRRPLPASAAPADHIITLTSGNPISLRAK